MVALFVITVNIRIINLKYPIAYYFIIIFHLFFAFNIIHQFGNSFLIDQRIFYVINFYVLFHLKYYLLYFLKIYFCFFIIFIHLITIKSQFHNHILQNFLFFSIKCFDFDQVWKQDRIILHFNYSILAWIYNSEARNFQNIFDLDNYWKYYQSHPNHRYQHFLLDYCQNLFNFHYLKLIEVFINIFNNYLNIKVFNNLFYESTNLQFKLTVSLLINLYLDLIRILLKDFLNPFQ